MGYLGDFPLESEYVRDLQSASLPGANKMPFLDSPFSRSLQSSQTIIGFQAEVPLPDGVLFFDSHSCLAALL